MEQYDFCSLNNLIESLVNTTSQYDEALTETIHNYDSMATKVEISLEESREYWDKLAEDERLSSGELAGSVIEDIESLLSEMKAILEELARLDKLFDKYYTKHKDDICLPSENLNGTTDYPAIVRRLRNKLLTEANECSRTIKSVPLQRIINIFSEKRKKQYANLVEYYSQSVQIAGIACADLPRKTSEYWDAIASRKEEEIAAAERESADLIVSIQNEKQEEINLLLSSFREKLDSFFPEAFLIRLSDCIDSGIVEDRNYSDEFKTLLPLGYYVHNFREAVHNDDILRIITEKLNRVMSDAVIILPAFFNAAIGNNFGIINNAEENAPLAKDFALSIMYAILAGSPAGFQKYILIDPEERTNSFRPMLNFISNTPEVMGEKILTTQEQMRKALSDLIAHIDNAAQRQFVGYANIFEYNKSVQERPESYRTMVIMDFPKYFDEQMLDMLWNIINNSNPYGVGVILQINDSFKDTRASERYYAMLEKIRNKVTFFENTSNLWLCGSSVTLLPCVFDENGFSRFAKSYKIKLENRKKQGVMLEKVVDIDNIGTGNSTDYLSIPFAIDETGTVKSLELGDPVASGLSHYALVTGSTGSGKSTLLHTIVMSAVIKYPPEELNIYLMDFKQGTEFKIYSEKQIPHIKLLSMDTFQEFGESIFSELCAEMDRRAELFKKASEKTGIDIRHISQYRKVTGNKIPRILAILDEFQMLFDTNTNRLTANSCGQMAGKLISMARVYGIHLIFATQTLRRIFSDSFSITRANLNEMHVRIGLRGTEAEAEELFGAANGKIAFSKYGELRGSGTYVEDDISCIPRGIQCAYCTAGLQKDLLEQIADLYSFEPANTRVFSGNYVPILEESKEFNIITPDHPILLLGEPVKIGPDLKIDFSSRKRNNLLIVGTNSHTMTHLTDLSVLSFKRFFSSDSDLYYLDGEKISGGDIPASTREILTGINNAHIINSESGTLSLLDEIYDRYLNRKRMGIRRGPQHILLFIKNLQWIDSINRIFRGHKVEQYQPEEKETASPEENRDEMFKFIPREKDPNDLSDWLDDMNAGFLSQKPTAASRLPYQSMLLDLIESGYMYGVNIVLTASDYSDIKDYMHDIILNFSQRIIFALNDNDADRIITGAHIQSIPDNILLYTNGINSAFQFKPFRYTTQS